MEQRSENIGLHERRRRNAQNGAVNFSQMRRPIASVRTDIGNKSNALRLAHMTPPETPMSPQEVVSNQNDSQSLFHNYLRAFCHFDQPLNDGEDSLLIIAPIRPGDLILVHSIHKNGWADGTVLTTGARGWLPTNYCETFDHPYMRNLLNAMTQFWDLLGAGEDANLSTFVRQDYIRGLIAGVRYLLEQADCLHRDAGLVQRHAGIRRMRKGLLADLASLVQIAKRLQETISEPFAGEVVHVLLDDLVAKAFKVVTRAVGFVDILAQEAAGTRHLNNAQPNSPNRNEEGLCAPEGLEIDTSSSLTRGVTTAIDSAIGFAPSTAAEEPNDIDQDKSARRSSVTFRPQSGLVAHRLSVVKAQHSTSGTLASGRLAQAHDQCISHTGAFIGLYMHSRRSRELVATTNRLVQACNALLAIVNQVSIHIGQQRSLVQHVRINFQRKLDELTRSTKELFTYSDRPDDDVVMLPEQTNHLVHVGTSLIRAAGECVDKTRKFIEQVGDFDLEHNSTERHHTSEEQYQLECSYDPPKSAQIESERPPTKGRRISKPLPPPPSSSREQSTTSTGVTDFALRSPMDSSFKSSPMSSTRPTSHRPLPIPMRSDVQGSTEAGAQSDVMKTPSSVRISSMSRAREYSVGASVAGSTDTKQSGTRDSGITTVSEVSTRATTPDHSKDLDSPDPGMINSFGSVPSLRSAAAIDAGGDVETLLLQKTFANELTLNKDGQVSGGSLPALVEQLTTHNIAPDPQFVAAFFITFRSFTTPRELAQALIYRFDYIGDSKTVGTPVRLRIYNVFKGWLETYWNAEADKDALGDVRYFALHKLKPHLPQAGDRLVELTRKVTQSYTTGNATGPLVSGVGKVSTSIGTQPLSESSIPEPTITKGQLNALRNAATTCSITDFDPLELARQLTILASTTFCDIQSEELLSLDWNKKDTTRARNVRSMCTLNTDLAHVVGDTILSPDDAKKRAAVIKHWSKVATSCLELNNYDSLMAIMCSLNSSVVQRLKRTWEVASKKTKARLDELSGVVDFSRNHASLRSRLEKPVAPCLPFLGIYLTDLTFVDAGNPKLRELPGTTSESGETVSVINFDKHMRMAKIISHLQKFQVPYKLKEVPEMQTWMQRHLQRMREGNAAMVGHLHRRSMVIEPKDSRPIKMAKARRHTEPDMGDERPKTSGSNKTARSGKTTATAAAEGQKFELFFRAALPFKARTDLPVPEAVEQR